MVRFLCGVAAVWMVVGSAQAVSPGFDCAKAGNAVEKAICASPELSALDGILSAIYTDARKAASDDDKKTMETAQKAWLKDRNACSKDQALATCLSASYVVRLKALKPQQAAAPGFDCAKAGSATEKRICESLSALDGILSGIYLPAYEAASEEDRKTMEAAQKAWLKERNACKDSECIYTLYGDRFASLRTAAPATATPPAASAPPGFDCAKAGNAVEKAICASPELSVLDGVLSAIYTDARKAASDDDKKTMETAQKAWLKDRNACSKDQAALASCLSASYVVRLKALKPQQAAAPGFDCAKAGSATEKRICESQGLSALDGILSGIYLPARKAASEEDRKTMETAQKAWLKERNACKDTDCLYTLYGDRFASLRTATPATATPPAASTPPAVSPPPAVSTPPAVPSPAAPQAQTAPTPLIPVPNAQPPLTAPTPLMPATPATSAPATPVTNADWVGKIEANLQAIDGCIALTPAFPVMVSSLYTEKGTLNVGLWASDGRAWSCLAGTNSTLALLDAPVPLAKGMTLFSRAPQAAFKGECITSEKVMQGDVLLGWISHKGC